MKKIMFITKKKIRKEIYRRFNDNSVEIIEIAYKWVSDAPFWQWNTRLWCVCNVIWANTDALNRAYDFISKGVLSKGLRPEQDSELLVRMVDAQMK